jgi:hypothetical protein
MLAHRRRSARVAAQAVEAYQREAAERRIMRSLREVSETVRSAQLTTAPHSTDSSAPRQFAQCASGINATEAVEADLLRAAAQGSDGGAFSLDEQRAAEEEGEGARGFSLDEQCKQEDKAAARDGARGVCVS